MSVSEDERWSLVCTDRGRLERLVGKDVRGLTSQLTEIARLFADRHRLSANEFRALSLMASAEADGVVLSAGDLRQRMGLSGVAITYLVARMVETGHLRREPDPTDGRKVILGLGEPGRELAGGFYGGLAQHHHAALAGLPDEDLHAAHRTLTAVSVAMRSFRAEGPPR